jgi:DNA-binding CsgD family transcriptional regulator/tetratricopeptide (TPR) repeat protein
MDLTAAASRVTLARVSAGPWSTDVAPFAGRAGELSLLRRRAEEARHGQPRVVLIEAEAGFGKSALLSQFLTVLDRARVLRASGDEAEALLAYGVLGQLLASAGHAAGPADEPATPVLCLPGVGSGPVPPRTDPLTAGAGLVTLLGQAQAAAELVVVAVDDAHWSDARSAAALLFAVRHMQSDRVLGVLTTRPGELARLGEGWSRFASGDHRASRIRLGGLAPGEIAVLGRALGLAELSGRAAARLAEYTGGSPLYCRILLEDTDPAQWRDRDLDAEGPPIPPALGGMLLARVRKLTEPAQELIRASAVLGRAADLGQAASLAGLADPVPALDEAVRTGLVRQEQGAAGSRLVFTNPLLHRAVYDSLGPAARRALHQRAVELVMPEEALAHRFAAASGPEAGLAAELEAAGRRASALGGLNQAASWLAEASAVSPAGPDRDRLLLDALDALLRCGDVAGAQVLARRVTQLRAGARRSALLGHLDLLAGRTQSAEASLTRAWQDHDPAGEPLVGAQAAVQMIFCCGLSGRFDEAITWGERAVAAADGEPAMRQHALGALAVAIASGDGAADALSRLGFVAKVPAEVPLELTDVLVNRGMVRVITEDLAGAVADLSAAADRLRAGVPLRYPGQCLGYLAEAEYRLGSWDDAAAHGELAVSLARAADRRWDLSFVHAFATSVPAARGEWEAAGGHVAEAGAAARESGTRMAITAWAAARAALGTARGDHEEVLRAAATVRQTGRAEFFGSQGLYGWRPLEVGALIGSGRLKQAARALAELRGSLTAASPASVRVAAESLRGSLAIERGDADAAEHAFAAAWRHGRGLALPFGVSRLELADGRRLRQAGRRPEAIARLRCARTRLASLGARPYLAACDAELTACGVQVTGQGVPETLGLTPSELAVARLVATGRSNREAAAELYVSVKAIEFHLGHVFTKLGIRSRRALAERLGGTPAEQPGEQAGLPRTGN